MGLPVRLLAAAVAALALAPAAAQAEVTTVDPSYEVVKQSNVYITVSDGTKLAADVYRPKPKAGQPADQKFPCLFEMTPYRKELRAKEAADFFPARGFVYVEVDARGTGGSTGQYNGVFLPAEQTDGYDAIEWLATQYPYCDGKVGMWGGSYSGINQYLIATSPKGTPPHLVTIAPQRALSDLYRDIVYTGGIATGSFGVIWSGGTTAYNAPGADPTTAPDPQVAAQAPVDHAQNAPMLTTYLGQPFDSPFYRASSVIDRLGELKMPILHLEGWYDAFTRGQLMLIGRLLDLERQGKVAGPNYAIVGPWNHGDSHFLAHKPFDGRILDWYRHWLDGAPAPAWFAEPRVNYCLMLQARNGDCEWRSSDSWPPAPTAYKPHYLQPAGAIGGSSSPGRDAQLGSWIYNPSSGQGENGFSKWDNAAGVPQRDANQAQEDEWKGLTFSTAPLVKPLDIHGPIELSLRASTTPLPGADSGLGALPQLAPPYLDTDFIVKLSDVAPDGSSTLIQDGFLRASHRKYDRSRTVFAGERVLQPFHWHDQAHLAPPEAGVPYRYEVEIWPTAKRFAAGHSLRIALYSADTANHLDLLKPVTNTVWGGSYLLLPEEEGADAKHASRARGHRRRARPARSRSR
jgi:putative CocE/NonD family hydrolase